MIDKDGFPLRQEGADKLTDWENEPDVAALKGDLEQAKPSQQSQIAKIRTWTDLLYVRGAAKPPKLKNRSSVQPKLIRRQAEWRYPALSEPFNSSPKLFSVNPATYADVDSARQNEIVINWQFRTKFDKVKLIDDIVRSTVEEGTCICRLGWVRVTQNVKQNAPVFDHYPLANELDAQNLSSALDQVRANPSSYDQLEPALQASVDHYNETGQGTVAVQTGTQEVTTEMVMENRPTVEVMNPDNVFIDPSCNGDFSKALFVVVSFETNKAELYQQPNIYKKEQVDKINWESNSPLAQPDHATNTPDSFQFNDRTRRKVVAYEYWGFYDINGDGTLVPIVATWVGDILIRLQENPYPDQELPFVVIPYLPVKRELYGEPDAELLEDNQRISGAITRGMIDSMGRSANGQQGFAKGTLDAVNRRRFEDGQDYEFNPDRPIQQAWIQHTFAELPQSAFAMLNLQNQEAEAMSGVKAFSGGLSGDAYGQVATGIQGVLDASAKREMSILRRLAKGVARIGEKIIAMNREFLSEQETIAVTKDEFVTVNREDLKGNFEMIVDISTAEVDNAKSQDLAFMLQTIGPNLDPKITTTIMAKIADLKRMPDLAHMLRNYQPPPPDPMQQQMAQLQLQTMQAELQKIGAQIQQLTSQAQLNQANAGVAQTEADQNNLDFVEQETGTAHAREMAKMRAQSEGNQNLEVTKALLKSHKPEDTKPNIAAAIGFNGLTNN